LIIFIVKKVLLTMKVPNNYMDINTYRPIQKYFFLGSQGYPFYVKGYALITVKFKGPLM